MTINSFNRVNASSYTYYTIYERKAWENDTFNSKPTDWFSVDYLGDADKLNVSIVRRNIYGKAEVVNVCASRTTGYLEVIAII